MPLARFEHVPNVWTGEDFYCFIPRDHSSQLYFKVIIIYNFGAGGSVVVKALSYKPEDRGFDTLWGEFLNVTNPSDRNRPWG
jgi:hypothetical protein